MHDRWPEKVEDVLRKRGDETGAPRRSLLSWRRSPATTRGTDGAGWREDTLSENAQTINISTLYMEGPTYKTFCI